MDVRRNGHAYTFDDSVRPTPSAIISPNKATIPNPLQTAPPTSNQVLQCPRLWDHPIQSIFGSWCPGPFVYPYVLKTHLC